MKKKTIICFLLILTVVLTIQLGCADAFAQNDSNDVSVVLDSLIDSTKKSVLLSDFNDPSKTDTAKIIS